MPGIEILRSKSAPSDSWDMKQLSKGNTVCMSLRKADTSECSVVSAAITTIAMQ